MWRGYELGEIARQFPVIAGKYGLAAPPSAVVGQFVDLALEISKISQAAYGALAVGADATAAVEASSALSELFSARAANMAERGRFLPLPRSPAVSLYPWVESQNQIAGSETALRAIISTLRFASGSAAVTVASDGWAHTLVPQAPRVTYGDALHRLMNIIAIWSDTEIVVGENGSLVVRDRAR
jgi:hypothetical protein